MPANQNQPVSTQPIVTQESRPVPDPTILTTQQTQREIAALQAVINEKLNVVEERFKGMDRAIELLERSAEHFPQLRQEGINTLQALHDEKFKIHEEKFISVQRQFVERDTRTEQSSKDSKVAVDAALQAAKEAVGEQNKSNALSISKSEAAFTKQIDQIVFLVQQQGKTVDDKIDDLKSRITTIESRKQGGNDMVSYIIAGVSVMVALGSLIAILLMNRV